MAMNRNFKPLIMFSIYRCSGGSGSDGSSCMDSPRSQQRLSIRKTKQNKSASSPWQQLFDGDQQIITVTEAGPGDKHTWWLMSRVMIKSNSDEDC